LPSGPKYATSFAFPHFASRPSYLVTQLSLTIYQKPFPTLPFLVIILVFAILVNILLGCFHFPLLPHGSANFLLSLSRLSNNVLHSMSTGYPAARLSSQDSGSLRQRSHPMNHSCRKILHHHQRDTVRLRHKCAFVNCKLYKGVICAYGLTDCSVAACKIPRMMLRRWQVGGVRRAGCLKGWHGEIGGRCCTWRAETSKGCLG